MVGLVGRATSGEGRCSPVCSPIAERRRREECRPGDRRATGGGEGRRVVALTHPTANGTAARFGATRFRRIVSAASLTLTGAPPIRQSRPQPKTTVWG